MPRLHFGAFLAPTIPSVSTRCCSSAAISTSWSTWTSSDTTNSGAASTIPAAGK